MQNLSRKQAKIRGTGSYLPEKILTNQDLEKMVETSDDWIVTRTGIKERRVAESDEYTSTMGIQAAKQAIERAKIDPKSIDLIVVFFVLRRTISQRFESMSVSCAITASDYQIDLMR